MDENRNKLYQVEDTIWVYCLHTKKKNFKLVVSSFRTKNLYCFCQLKKDILYTKIIFQKRSTIV